MIAGPSLGTALRCPKCALGLDPAVAGTGAELTCPACRTHFIAQLFPAFVSPVQMVSTASGERAVEGEAVCFFHPEKGASVACERCGRFLCALCDVPLGGKHLCPSCLDTTKMPELVNRRLIWSQLSMLVGILPIVFACLYPFYVITGPAAIFLGIWKWKAPGSLVRGPRRGLAVVGIIGGTVQILIIAGAVFGLYYAIKNE
jgi:hypothetical protein